MATPSEKSPAMEQFLDTVSENMNGVKRTDSIKADKCVSCKGDATDFRNEISKREYTISGLCQSCQDSIFGVD